MYKSLYNVPYWAKEFILDSSISHPMKVSKGTPCSYVISQNIKKFNKPSASSEEFLPSTNIDETENGETRM